MNSPLLGATLPQFTEDRGAFIEAALRAEALGLDSIWLFDHMWPLTGGKARPVIESWTALAYIAAATSRIKIGTLVTRSSLRHPSLLGKMAATVGAIAPGRLIIGIGSGDEASRDENEAFGFPYYGIEDRVGQLGAAVSVLTRYLGGDAVTVQDRFVSVEELEPSPKLEPRPAVWLGGRSGDVLELAGRSADGWNGWGGNPKRFAQDSQQVLSYANGRPIELSWGGVVVLRATDQEAQKVAQARDGGQRLWGGPDRIAARLKEFTAAGAGHLIVTLANAADPQAYELFGGPVAELLRR
jgi:alkanesulfonate monooxygenase SsuD/methylene tetrahydromethanopterin reductase-like flavin-dependent oxidoreductase (luciferase family)